MKSKPNLHIASKTIGTTQQAVAPPERTARVVHAEFGVAATQPLRGAVPLADFVAELENDTSMASEMAEARKALAPLIGSHLSLRQLRMAAGMSQAKLAIGARTTQPYVARVESGSTDPGTDMVARLANAIGVSEDDVFRAIRSQRTTEDQGAS